MAEQTVREQLAEALDDQRLAVEIFIVEMDKAMVGPSTYERGQKLAGLLGDLQRSLDDSKPALDRHRAEPEGHTPSCCYDETREDCPCYQGGLAAQRERVGGGAA